MEQHAIPQQISSYEFKLVGDMTLKQFLKAAVGIVVAFLINSSKLIFFLKYPLMLFFGAGGLLIAFVPFQDRPLETWVIAFLRSIYSPTIYTYKKSVNDNWLDLSPKKKVEVNTAIEEEQAPIKDEKKVKEFIESLPSVKAGREVREETIQEQVVINNPTDIGKIGMTTESKLPMREEEPVKEEVDWRDQKANLNLKSERLEATSQAIFGAIPMPDKPEVPNMVVGMVTDINGKIVEGAIVEIQDDKGNPARVLKTNPLGQFKTSTPLANGRYLVITEKEKYQFERVEVVLDNKIIDPIKIQSII